jgi:hypothetical protein
MNAKRQTRIRIGTCPVARVSAVSKSECEPIISRNSCVRLPAPQPHLEVQPQRCIQSCVALLLQSGCVPSSLNECRTHRMRPHFRKRRISSRDRVVARSVRLPARHSAHLSISSSSNQGLHTDEAWNARQSVSSLRRVVDGRHGGGESAESNGADSRRRTGISTGYTGITGESDVDEKVRRHHLPDRRIPDVNPAPQLLVNGFTPCPVLSRCSPWRLFS